METIFNYEKRTDIKIRLKENRKKLADLSRYLNINYDVLNSYTNGRRITPKEIESKIDLYFKELNGSV